MGDGCGFAQPHPDGRAGRGGGLVQRRDTSIAVMRTASPSVFSSALTSTFDPDARISRDRFSTSLKQVTSTEPAASEMRTQAMRLPVRVIRSLVATTVPAIFTRLDTGGGAAFDMDGLGDTEPLQGLGIGVERDERSDGSRPLPLRTPAAQAAANPATSGRRSGSGLLAIPPNRPIWPLSFSS